MYPYEPPLLDVDFAVRDWLNAPADWSVMPAYQNLDIDTYLQIVAAAGRFAAAWLAPINASGDAEGCRLIDGVVRTPAGFRDAYAAYVAGGWPSLACAADCGGQGLPLLLNTILIEFMNSTNHAWTMAPGLAHGAYECIRAHATSALAHAYLPKLVSGEWLATMCLTEAHAGTDLSLLQTRAVPDAGRSPLGRVAAAGVADPLYRITGTKIYISGGAHDLTDNIVHLVLARLPEAPAGTKGLSLFLVPQRLGFDGDAQANSVFCDGIEHKMGIKGSPTCVLRFDDAVGWLIGAPNRGLAAMFVMMNAARVHVGVQGLAHTEAAYQCARHYAQERRQMRAVESPAARAGDAADPIALHPPIRRTLLELRATAEGERAIAYWATHLLDLSAGHPSAERRRDSLQLCSLLTPAIKAFFTANGFRLSSKALQVLGGSGYIRGSGIEQIVRDSRIAMIYEGTNEIQAIDLLVRKVLGDGGSGLTLLLTQMAEESDRCRETAACRWFGERLAENCALLVAILGVIRESAQRDAEAPYRAADDFLQAFGLLLLAFAWARSARVSQARAASSALHADKLTTAQFCYDYLLPEFDHRLTMVRASCAGLAHPVPR